MTNHTLASPAHPSDADVLRYHDGELPADERSALDRHLAECAICRETLHLFDAMSSSVRVMDPLPPSDFARRRARNAARAARRVRRTRVVLRAAVAVLAVGSVGAVTPVRAWLVDLLRRPASETETPAPAPAPDAEPQPGSTVSFVPSGSIFVVELAAAQPAGTLTLRPGDGPAVSARVADGRAGVGLLVVDNGFRIRNQATDSTSYVVTIPPSIERVDVRRPDGTTESYDRNGMTEDVVIAFR